MMTIHLTINGESVTADVRPEETLVSLIRRRMGLTGTKESCNVGECGACTVILDGKAVKSCVTLAAQCEGSSVITIEGLQKDGELHPLQRCFVEKNAVQCGFCTPGFIMSAKALLDRNPHPTREEVKVAIAGNLCRCTGYEQLIEAVLDAAGR